jgi:hypothetical protein
LDGAVDAAIRQIVLADVSFFPAATISPRTSTLPAAVAMTVR